MRKSLIGILAFVLLITTVASNSFAQDAAKLGGTCSHPGSVAPVGGQKIICAVISEHLAVYKPWSAELQKDPFSIYRKSASGPNPNSVQIDPKTLIIPKSNELPTSFSNLWEFRKGVSYQAWKKISDILKKYSSTSSKKTSNNYQPVLHLYVGPNSLKPNIDLLKGFAIIHNVFSEYDPFKNIYVFIYNAQDHQWANTIADQVMGPTLVNQMHSLSAVPDQSINSNYPNNNENDVVHCVGVDSCNASNAWADGQSSVYIGLGLPNQIDQFLQGPNSSFLDWSGSEFWHALWFEQYQKNGSLQPIRPFAGGSQVLGAANNPPLWFTMASEQFSQDIIEYSNSYSKYLTDMVNRYSNVNHVIKTETPDLGNQLDSGYLTKMLDISHATSVDTLSWQNGNYYADLTTTLVPRIIEILVALKGPSITLDIPKDMSKGMSFEDSFKKEFGTTWQEVTPIIIKVLLDEYQNHY